MQPDDVLEFLKSNKDKKFKSYVLAKMFNVSTKQMADTLLKLSGQVESEVIGKGRYFWVMSPEVKKQKDERKNQLQSQFEKRKGVLKLDQKMKDAMARCVADRGGEYHPITIS